MIINRKKKTCLVVTLVGMLLCAQTSSAFYLGEYKGRHPDNSVTFHVNLPGVSPNSGFPFLPAFERALVDWNLATAVNIDMIIAETADSCNTEDGINAVSFVKNLCGKNLYAIAFMPGRYQAGGDGINWEWVETNIAFAASEELEHGWGVREGAARLRWCNGFREVCATGFAADGLNTFSRAARHEIGHALGLSHSRFLGSTMRRGGWFHLSDDDICGVELLYGNPDGCPLWLGTSTTARGSTIEEAAFTGGASADRGETYQSTFSPDDYVSVFSTIVVEDAQVAQEGNLFVVVALEDGRLFAKNSDGAFVPVDGSLENLPAYQTKALNIANEVIVLEEFVPASIGVANQTLSIYIGYALVEYPSNLYYSSKPITVHIHDSP